ncbi:uncharacterized protein [Apostichopus japonicus]|uniref:uncharacterized protein isoform X2 n=1 Tax=Stichopus japonicus TaxID=307972 RepID=UPI003AB7E835
MAPWKGAIPTIVLLLLGSISSNEITKTPSSGLFLNGSDVTLSCTVQGNNYVLWDDLSDATSIFIGKEKNTEKKKYDNFEISSGDEDFSLIIRDVQLSDEGTYVCKDRDRLANATVTIGVLPTLHLCVKESEATHVPQSSTKVNITCSAYNARPAVSVFELSVVGSEKTVNITNDKSNQNEDGKTYNSSATVPFIVSSKDISVHCRVYTAGQSLNHAENFNLPRCNITISGNEARCRCKANPPVDKYRMELNGNLRDGDVLYIEESNSTNVTCFGTNGMGTGRSSILFPGDKAGFGIFSVVVTISVGVVLMVLAVICINRRMSSRRGKSDEEQPIEEETNTLLPSLGAISHEEQLTKSVEENDEKLGITENIPMNVSDPSTVSPNETSCSNKGNPEELGITENTPMNDSDPVTVSPNETSGSNKGNPEELGITDNIPMNDSDPVTVSPNETSGSNKELQQAVQQLSSRIICDWEIFAVKDLKIEKEDVETLSQCLTVTPSGVLVQDCVKLAIFKWIAKKDEPDINQLLTHTIISSKVCNDFLCNDCVSYFQHKPGFTISENECNGRRNKEQDKIVLSDKRQPASFATILRWIANLVGKVGSEYLMKSYGDTLGNIKVTNSSTPCHELFEQLVEKKLLSNETSSLQSLCEHLRNCYLFSAERITLLYIERIMPSQNLLRTIEIITPFDWDLFAKEKLKLTEDVIESAIKCYSGVEDQFEAVLCQFLYTSETNQCVAHLENILSESIQEYNGCYSYKSSVSSQHAFLKHDEHKEEPVSAVKHELAGTTGDTAPDIDLGIQQDQTSEHTEPMETSEWNKRFEKMYEKVELEEMKVNCGDSSFTADKNKQELVIGVLNSLERVSTGLKRDIERYIDWLAEECGKHMTLLCCVRLLSILENSMDVAKSKNPGGDVLKVAISLPNSRKIFQHFGLLIDEKLEFLLRLNENVGHITGSKPRVKENLHQTEIRCPDCGVSLYQLMLDQLGDILGTVGSERIAKAYNLSESMIEMINTLGHPGHLLVPELIRTGHEIQSKESLQNLEFYLQQTGLFRASYIIRDFMRKQRPSTFNVDNKDQVTQV